MNARYLTLFLLLYFIEITKSDIIPEERIFISSVGFFNTLLRIFRMLYSFGGESKEMEYSAISHLGYNHLQRATNSEVSKVIRDRRRKRQAIKRSIFFSEERNIMNGTVHESIPKPNIEQVDLKYESTNFTLKDYLSEVNNITKLAISNNFPLFSKVNVSIASNVTTNMNSCNDSSDLSTKKHEHGSNITLGLCCTLECVNSTFRNNLFNTSFSIGSRNISDSIEAPYIDHHSPKKKLR